MVGDRVDRVAYHPLVPDRRLADLAHLHVIVPVRALADGKRRLSPVLDADRRAAIIEGLLRRTLEVVHRWAAAEAIHVVSPDPAVALQNRVFAKYAHVHDLAFIDVARLLPFDPDLYVDAIHNSYAGERLRAWVFLQGLMPVVERHLKSGAWPKKVEAAKTPAPAFKPRPITFACTGKS